MTASAKNPADASRPSRSSSRGSVALAAASAAARSASSFRLAPSPHCASIAAGMRRDVSAASVRRVNSPFPPCARSHLALAARSRPPSESASTASMDRAHEASVRRASILAASYPGIPRTSIAPGASAPRKAARNVASARPETRSACVAAGRTTRSWPSALAAIIAARKTAAVRRSSRTLIGEFSRRFR